MKIIAIIPAKSMSRRIPGKNLRMYKGKPLFVHTLDAAMKSKLIDAVILSTDSDDIISIAHELYPSSDGKLITSRRHAAYLMHHVEVDELARHEMRLYEYYFNKSKTPDVVVTLQPTSPQRTAGQIDEAITMHLNNDMRPTIIGVCETEEDRINGYLWRDLDGIFSTPIAHDPTKRTSTWFPDQKVFVENGSIYVTNGELFSVNGTMRTQPWKLFVMPDNVSDIDWPEDLNDED